ncbi:MAG: hypothetical protein R3C05_29765 [Pirellulaceae bacterium]
MSLIKPVSVTTSTTGDAFPVGQLLDASLTTSGFPEADPSGLWATNDPNGPSGDYFAGGTASPILTFDLGSIQSFDQLVAWGYTASARNSVKSLTLEFSTDNGATFGPAVALEMPIASELSVSMLPIGQTVQANVVRMTLTDNYFEAGQAGGDRVGLGEVRFLAGRDQRGGQFSRTLDGNGDGLGIADIGAIESPIPSPSPLYPVSDPVEQRELITKINEIKDLPRSGSTTSYGRSSLRFDTARRNTRESNSFAGHDKVTLAQHGAVCSAR